METPQGPAEVRHGKWVRHPALTASWLGLSPVELLTLLEVTVPHTNKEPLTCSCSTVSASWGAGVCIPGEGAPQGQGWRVGDSCQTDQTLVF